MSDSVSTNIFIAHTPLQNFIALKISQQYFPADRYRNVLCSSVPSKNADHFQDYFYINKHDIFQKVRATINAKKNLTKIIKSTECNLFMAHTSTLLDNYFFYSFPGEKYKLRYNFYYEGILYFYKYMEVLSKKVYLTRKYMAYLTGFKYQLNPDIFPDMHPGISHIYSILPKFTIGPPEKVKRVSVLKEHYNGQADRALIIGGKPKALNDEDMIAIYEQMIQKIQSKDQQMKVYFKGHHADRTENFSTANNGRIKIKDITQDSPIEEVIEAYEPAMVLSYPSSALINLKAMYGDRIQIFSYYIDEKKDHLNQIWPIFEHLNIRLKLL